MKRLPYAVVVMLGLTGGAYAADFGDLSVMSASGLKAMMADAAALQIPEPQNIGKHHCSGRDLGNASSARKGAEAVLANPAAFTVKQMGDVLVNLDDVCSSLSVSSSERLELNALRDAVNNAQREKVRQQISHRN